MTGLAVALVLCGVTAPSVSCGSQCGLALKERVSFPGAAELRVCCGDSLYRDVNLVNPDIQVDLANSSTPGRVDAFLTDANCAKLFDTYSGARSGALCPILIGPVSGTMVSQRREIAPGRYRIFAQAWSSNNEPTPFVFDLGVWSDDCRYRRSS